MGSEIFQKSRNSWRKEGFGTVLRIQIRDPVPFCPLDPGWDPGIFLTPNPGRKKFGSGINIPDPQYWIGNISVALKIFIVFVATFCIFLWESS
jgi:hypothetical protein